MEQEKSRKRQLWGNRKGKYLLCLLLCLALMGCGKEDIPVPTESATEPVQTAATEPLATLPPETTMPEEETTEETTEATEAVSITATEKEMLTAFVDYMNEKALSLGMTGSKFNDPVGMYNFTTARDMLHLLVCAEGYEALQDIWSAESHSFQVEGENAREHTVVSTFRGNPMLEPYYTILGGKDGELPAFDVRNLAVILEIPDSDDKLAVVALCAYGQSGGESGSRAAVRQIADAALRKYQDPTADNSDCKVFCQSAMACLIPAEGADPENLQILYEKDPDSQKMPASVTKILTAICLLDLQKDLEETFSYSVFDTNIGGFYDYDLLPGDVVTYRDGLYAMLLPSSNVSARALARMGGLAILKQEATQPEA